MVLGRLISSEAARCRLTSFQSCAALKLTRGRCHLPAPQVPALRYPDVIRRAVHRYETLWLPLAGENNGERLPAPLDIEWAWHCHMLAPVAYQRDCLNVVGVVVDHELLSMKDREHKLKRSRRLWEDKFPKEPFDVDLTLGALGPPTSFPPSRLSYDIPAASDRQAVFNYQVSLPHFRDSRFLKAAVQRYRKLLYLKQQNPDVFLAPCYDMDIIWHSHQLHPLVYLKDTESILGRTYDHNDAVNDRSEGSKLSKANSITRELWKTTFNENYSLFGAMYRGDPPTNQLTADLLEKQIQLFASKVTTVRFERLELKISSKVYQLISSI
nr:hypothetical protein BaRGS_016948 [Batillaria attramentaria]